MPKIFKTKCQICGKDIIGKEPYYALENTRSRRSGDINFCGKCEAERQRLVTNHKKTEQELERFMNKFNKIWNERIKKL